MSRKSVPIHMIVYQPKTERGKHKLAQRAAELHAETAEHMIQKLDCPIEQKKQLLDAVIKEAKMYIE